MSEAPQTPFLRALVAMPSPLQPKWLALAEAFRECRIDASADEIIGFARAVEMNRKTERPRSAKIGAVPN